MTLKEFNYNGFGDDDHLNPDGSKKKWPHKRKEAPIQSPKLIKAEKDLTNLERQLKSLKIKISRTKNEEQKYVLVNDRQNPLIAKIQNLKKEIKTLLK